MDVNAIETRGKKASLFKMTFKGINFLLVYVCGLIRMSVQFYKIWLYA